jgi:uncharacterized protein YjbJ (UPF0337 family)
MPNPRHEGPADYLGNIVEGNIDDRSNKGSDSMGWDEIERSWNELKGEVKQQWSKLTDEDVEIIKGKHAELLGLLQARYGHAKERPSGKSMIGLSGSGYIASPSSPRFAMTSQV